MDKKQSSWRFLCESRKYFYAVILLFLFSGILAFFFQPSSFVNFIVASIKQLMLQTQDLDFFGLFWFIFLNNLTTSFVGFIFGIFFAVVPIVIALFNGYLLGFVADLAIGQAGVSSLWRLLPHGIFEFPAIILSLGIGIRLGLWPFHARNKKKSLYFYFLPLVILFTFFFLISLCISALAAFQGVETGQGSMQGIYSSNLFSALVMLLVFFSFSYSIRVLEKKDRADFMRLFSNSLRAFFFVVLPLLLIAALIESGLIVLLK